MLVISLAAALHAVSPAAEEGVPMAAQAPVQPPVQASVQVAEEGAVARFRRLRSEGVDAIRADDLETAAARLAEADSVVPNHPGLILLRARVAAAMAAPDEALAHIDRYARAGLTVNLPADLAALDDAPGFAAIAQRLAANAAPHGAERLSVVFRMPGAGLTEGVARDEARGLWLVSQVAGRTILAVDGQGTVTPWSAPDADLGGVAGLAVDAGRDRLWAASAPLPPSRREGAEAPPSALLEFELSSGRLVARHALPGEAGDDASLGDVALAPDGVLYAADSMGGGLYRLTPGGGALQTLVPPGVFGSPQGMAVAPDGRGLIVADYSSGLYRVDLGSGAVTRMAAPEDAVLIGIDGLVSDGAALYAVQNGVAPQRVLKLTPDAGWRGLEGVTVMAAALPELSEPTTAMVLGRDLVLVARSQWGDFAPDGALRTPDPEPAIIARLALD